MLLFSSIILYYPKRYSSLYSSSWGHHFLNVDLLVNLVIRRTQERPWPRPLRYGEGKATLYRVSGCQPAQAEPQRTHSVLRGPARRGENQHRQVDCAHAWQRVSQVRFCGVLFVAYIPQCSITSFEFAGFCCLWFVFHQDCGGRCVRPIRYTWTSTHLHWFYAWSHCQWIEIGRREKSRVSIRWSR